MTVEHCDSVTYDSNLKYNPFDTIYIKLVSDHEINSCISESYELWAFFSLV